MYLAKITYPNAKGDLRQYLYICQSVRLPAKKHPVRKKLFSFGRIDNLSQKHRQQLLTLAQNMISILSGNHTDSFHEVLQTLVTISSLSRSGHTFHWAMLEIVQAIWKRLGITDIFENIQKQRKIRYDVYHAVLYMVVARLFGIQSERALYHWQNKIPPGMPRLQLHQLYRSLDIVCHYWTEIEKKLLDYHNALATKNPTILYVDATSLTYWGEGDGDLCQRGMSKQKRRDKKQVVVGLTMIDELPIAIEIAPGNTGDIRVMQHIRSRLHERLGIDTSCLVCDAAMINKKDLQEMRKNQVPYIVRAKRNEKKVRKKAYEKLHNAFLEDSGIKQPDPSCWETYDEQLNVLRASLPPDQDGHAEDLLIIWSRDRAGYDLYTREKIVEKLQEFAGKSAKNLLKNHKGTKYLKSPGIIELQQEAVQSDAFWDGIWLLRTNQTHETTRELITYYKSMYQIEQLFKELKQELSVVPLFHRTTTRMKGHIYTAFLTLLAEMAIKKRVKKSKRLKGLTWYQVKEEIENMNLEWLHAGKHKILLHSDVNKTQEEILSLFDVTYPQKIRDIKEE